MCQRGHCILLGLWGEAGESSGTRMLNQQVGQKREEDREVLVPSRHLWAFCLLGVEQAGLSAVEMHGVTIWDVGVSGGESSGLHHRLTDRWMCKAAVQIEHDGDWEEVERPGRQIDICFYVTKFCSPSEVLLSNLKVGSVQSCKRGNTELCSQVRVQESEGPYPHWPVPQSPMPRQCSG